MSILGWCSLYVIIGCLGLIWDRRLADYSSLLLKLWRLMEEDEVMKKVETAAGVKRDMTVAAFMYRYVWSLQNMIKWILFWPAQLGPRIYNYQLYWACTKEVLDPSLPRTSLSEAYKQYKQHIKEE